MRYRRQCLPGYCAAASDGGGCQRPADTRKIWCLDRLIRAEKCLWQQLREETFGVKFKRQHIIYDFIADFVCLEKKLIIEVDGAYHFTEVQMEYDVYRTEELERFGFRVLRFTNEEVINETMKVITTIKTAL